MKHSFTISFIFLLMMLLGSCSPEIETPTLDANGLDFSQFVACGDGFTAGVSNGILKTTGEVGPQGGLYEKAQYMSFPNILAQTFNSLGVPVEFNQPIVPGEGAGRSAIVRFDQHPCDRVIHHDPFLEQFPLQVNPVWYSEITQHSNFNNMGIPGLRARDLNDITALNELPVIMGMRDSTSLLTYRNWVETRDVSFFSVWLGMEDLLSWVYMGTPANNAPLSGPEFEAHILEMLDAVSGNNAHGMIANIPDITKFPFFTTVGHSITTRDCKTEELHIATLQLPRPIVEGEQILLSAARRISPEPGAFEEGGYNNPLSPKFVLEKDELFQLRDFITEYNIAIESAIGKMNQSGDRKIALVDLHKLYEEVQSGINMNGGTLDGSHLYGGFFSVDGIHPTGRGNALIANEYIKSINANFGTTLPGVDVNRYPTVSFP